MRKWVSVLLIIMLGLFIMPWDRQKQKNRTGQGQTAHMETVKKASLVQQDISHTDRLCRLSCTADFKSAAARIGKKKRQKEIVKTLNMLLADNPDMKELIWSPNGQNAAEEIKLAREKVQWKEELAEWYRQAKQSTSSGQIYQSPSLDKDGSVYFVLGVPNEDNTASLMGLIRQDILKKVERDQRKNLRMVPYPKEGHMKLESVDSDSLKDVKVKNGEDNAGTSHYHKNQVVVKFKNQPDSAQLNRIKQELGAVKVKKLGYTYVFEAQGKTAKQLMAYFQKWKVEYVEPHFYYTTNNKRFGGEQSFVPNDVLYSEYQWNLPIVETEKGWAVSRGDKHVIVAVIDTGVDGNHPDLQGHLLKGVNIVNEGKKPQDDVGHGTHVAGIISALVNNGEGVAGMTWYNPILPVKVLDETGSGNTYSVAQGIIWATDNGAKVINMSLGNYTAANFLHDAVRYAFDHDVVLIAASGNDNTSKPGYPAAYPEVMAVSAIDPEENRASFSNFGSYIDVMAPGVSIASTYPGNQYAAMSGTSMASPHVTALAALIRSANPLLKNTEVMDIIRRTAKDLGAKGKDNYYGYGSIDVVAALQRANQSRYSLTFWPTWLKRGMQRMGNK